MGCKNVKYINLDEEDLQYLVKHTRLNEAQVKVNFQKFLKKHPDGKLNRESFGEMMRICYPHTDSTNIENHIFRVYDVNKVCIVQSKEF